MSPRANKRPRNVGDDGDTERYPLLVTPSSTPIQSRSGRPAAADPEDSFSADEDNNVETATYSQRQERMPKCAAYDHEVESLQQRAHDLLSDLSFTLGLHQDVGSQDLQEMYSNAKAIARTPAVKKLTIMVMGGTGSGKSSLVNSVVDDLGASKAVATGSSCTAVPTLLTSRLDGQVMAYAAEVLLLDPHDIQNLLEEQLSNYTQFHFNADAEWDTAERAEHSKRADSAENVFRTLFCDKKDFASQDAIKNYLRDKQSDTDKQALTRQMYQWCQELVTEFAVVAVVDGQRCIKFEAETADELNHSLEPWTFDRLDFGQPALYLLVKLVRKGFMESRVLEFIDLMDLPGTADINSVRSGIAQKFVQTSDGLWVVGNIDRIIADEHVDYLLSTYADKFGDCVSVIATSSDAGLNENLAKEMSKRRQSEQSMIEYIELGKQMAKHRVEITSIRTELKQKMISKRQRRFSDQEEAKLRAKRSQLEDEIQRLRNARAELLVAARNADISRRLVDEKKKHLAKNATLRVFCVSNSHYMGLKGVDSEDAAQLSADATGIPALREETLKMVALGYFRNINAWFSTSLGLVKGAALWVDSTPTNSNQKILNLIREPSRLLEAEVQSFLIRSIAPIPPPPRPWFLSSFVTKPVPAGVIYTELLQPLQDGLGISVLTALGIQKRDIDGMNGNSLRAFFRKNGRHQPKHKAYQIWNESFTAKQTELVIDPGWARMVDKQRILLNGMVEKINQKVQKIPDQLRKLLPPDRVQNLVAGYCNRVQISYEVLLAEMDRNFSNIKLNATRDVETAHFTKAMKPMYDLAKSRSGRGSADIMRGDLSTELSKQPDQSAFAAAHRGLEADLIKASNTIASDVQRGISAVLDEMHAQFKTMLEKEKTAPDDSDVREQIRPFLQEKLAEVDSIEQAFEQIKQRYRNEDP